nr:potassium ABC transporter ATPase [Mycobacterium colombiense]
MARDGEMMGVVVYLVLTVAVFAVLGLAQKLVERL